MDKTIRRVTDPKAQRAEDLRYWQSLPAAERFSAVWKVTVSAYAFAGNRSR